MRHDAVENWFCVTLKHEVRVGVECQSIGVGSKNQERVMEACDVGTGRNTAVLVHSGCPRDWGAHSQKFISPRSGGWGVQDQDTSRVGVW